MTIEVRFTIPFKRRFKDLSKRYRKIQADIQPIVDALQAGEIVGNQITGRDFTDRSTSEFDRYSQTIPQSNYPGN